MNNKQAVEILKANEERKLATDYCRIKDMAISALEKQIPKKVKIKVKKDEQNRKYHHCPICNRWLTTMANYCSDCGQALDWSKQDG